MDRSRFLASLDADGRRLGAAAAADLEADVPACPGWTVRDVVEHTAVVYEHKLACVRLGGDRPAPWPPAWPADRDPLAWYADAHGRLLGVLASTDPEAPSWSPQTAVVALIAGGWVSPSRRGRPFPARRTP